MTPMTPAAPVCTEACWTPVSCPTCGRKLTPRGRSAPLECFSDCCEEFRNSTLNRRHLWDEHDSTRIHALIAEVRRLRERQEDDTVLLGTIAGERDAALAERDAARAALQAVEWTSLDPLAIETPQCPWCLSYEEEGHTTDCQCQAALGRGEGE